MRYDLEHIGRWLGALLVLLLTACSSSSSSGGDDPEPTGKPALKIYVFPPDRPVVTRADVGNVDASDAENQIHTICVWVFERDETNLGNSLLVGHINLNNFSLSETGSGEITLDVTDAFADKISNAPTIDYRPKVDVYVAANVTSSNCGLTPNSLMKNGETTESQVEALLIENHFGLTTKVSEVPADGLPMSGVLKNQQISGTSPVFRVGSPTTLATVRLVRAVSKVRFVFCQSTANNDNLTINRIDLGYVPAEAAAVQLPSQEYLFLGGPYPDYLKNIPDGVGREAVTTMGSNVSDINRNDSLSAYSYAAPMSGQDYENHINWGIKQEKLSEVGRFYLRESDNGLAGKIYYTIVKEGETSGVMKERVFKTTGTTGATDDNDFTRNHTWIVYGYFVTSGDLEVSAVEIKDWVTSDTPAEVYNW